MHGKQLMLPGEIVKKSNALCRATWAPDAIWEARLIAIVATYVNTNDTDFHEYEIRISDIIGNKKDGRTYKRICDTLDKALKHIIRIKEDNGSISSYTIFSKCNTSPTRDTVFVSFHPDLKPHFLQLKEKFTHYNILEFMVLPSIYSQRLFEILKSYDELQEIIIELVILYEMLDVPISLMIYKNFKTKILEKSYKIINEKTSLHFTWEPIKTKNKVTAIKFIFEKETPKEKIKKCDIKPVSEHIQPNTTPLNITYNSAINCLISHPDTCTPHLDHTPETCAVCPRYMKKPKN